MLKKIENDVYNISKRIKSINPLYEIYYNTDNKKYEVHHIKQKKDLGFGFLFTIPYDSLDVRTLDFTLKTRASNIDIKKYLDDIDKYNQDLEDKQISESLDRVSYESKEILKYLDKSVTRDWI